MKWVLKQGRCAPHIKVGGRNSSRISASLGGSSPHRFGHVRNDSNAIAICDPACALAEFSEEMFVRW
jgi:hypothetical protein